MEVLRTDVAIIGGGLGACAAALAAARLGRRVILTEETHWLGGQLTNQAVPPDEHPWIEEFGATASYRALRDGIRDYYRAHLPLTPRRARDATLNPGNGWVSRLCHDPRDRGRGAAPDDGAAPAQRTAVRACIRTGRSRPGRTATASRAWSCAGLESGRDSLIEAPFFIDATPYGDLLRSPASSTCSGPRSRAETGEPHAAERADPRDQQAITVCFAMEHLPGEDHTIDKPRAVRALARPSSRRAGRGRCSAGPRVRPGDARAADPLAVRGRGRSSVVALPADPRPRRTSSDGFARSDITVVNWPQNDYWFGPVVGVDAGRARAQSRGRAAAQPQPALLAADGGAAPRRRRRLPGPAPARRRRRRHAGRARARALRAGVAPAARRVHGARAAHRASAAARRPELFDDSVGIGCYRIDLHPAASAEPATSTSAAGRSRSRSAR